MGPGVPLWTRPDPWHAPAPSRTQRRGLYDLVEEHLGRKHATLENLFLMQAQHGACSDAGAWAHLQGLEELGQQCGLDTAAWMTPQARAILALIPSFGQHLG